LRLLQKKLYKTELLILSYVNNSKKHDIAPSSNSKNKLLCGSKMQNKASVDRINYLASKYGYAKEIMRRFITLFGSLEAEKMIKAYEKPLPETIRVNTLKTTPEKLLKVLRNRGFKFQPITWYAEGFEVTKSPHSLGATPEYLAGEYFLQSKASWLPVLVLNPKEEDVILDLAAAPGGKASHISQLMKNTGTLICIDISRERMKSLRSNLSRCGIQNTICIRQDARKFVNEKRIMDKVLCDVPCSGEGLMASDPSRRKDAKIHDIKRLQKLQKELVEAGLSVLKKDGIMVYSSCSTAPEENEEVISWALDKFPIDIKKTSFTQFSNGLTKGFERSYNKELQKAVRLYPHKNSTEGFFLCKIQLKERL
jgi:NOL1/NOP2/sun family putative RNA methylase